MKRFLLLPSPRPEPTHTYLHTPVPTAPPAALHHVHEDADVEESVCVYVYEDLFCTAKSQLSKTKFSQHKKIRLVKISKNIYLNSTRITLKLYNILTNSNFS